MNKNVNLSPSLNICKGQTKITPQKLNPASNCIAVYISTSIVLDEHHWNESFECQYIL